MRERQERRLRHPARKVLANFNKLWARTGRTLFRCRAGRAFGPNPAGPDGQDKGMFRASVEDFGVERYPTLLRLEDDALMHRGHFRGERGFVEVRVRHADTDRGEMRHRS